MPPPIVVLSLRYLGPIPSCARRQQHTLAEKNSRNASGWWLASLSSGKMRSMPSTVIESPIYTCSTVLLSQFLPGAAALMHESECGYFQHKFNLCAHWLSQCLCLILGTVQYSRNSVQKITIHSTVSAENNRLLLFDLDVHMSDSTTPPAPMLHKR